MEKGSVRHSWTLRICSGNRVSLRIRKTAGGKSLICFSKIDSPSWTHRACSYSFSPKQESSQLITQQIGETPQSMKCVYMEWRTGAGVPRMTVFPLPYWFRLSLSSFQDSRRSLFRCRPAILRSKRISCLISIDKLQTTFLSLPFYSIQPYSSSGSSSIVRYGIRPKSTR